MRSARWISVRGTPKSVRPERRATPVASHAHIQFFFILEQQKAALGAGHRKRRIHHRRQDVVGGERALQRAGNFHQRPQLRKIAGPGCGLRRHLLHEPANLVVFEGENKAVRILEAEIDPVRVGKLVPLHALPIDKHAVAAVQILDEVIAILGRRCARAPARRGYRVAPGCCRLAVRW